jgi:hypothetical protein
VAHFRNPDLPQAAAEDDLVLSKAIDCLRLKRATNRHSIPAAMIACQKRAASHNNAKDKTPPVENGGGVVVGGQPVGIAHAKLLGRPPTSRPHQTVIKIS